MFGLSRIPLAMANMTNGPVLPEDDVQPAPHELHSVRLARSKNPVLLWKVVLAKGLEG